jgi:hypothetical protein
VQRVIVVSDHTHGYKHIGKDSPVRGIGPSQRHLSPRHKIQQTSRIQGSNPHKRDNVRPRGHPDRLIKILWIYMYIRRYTETYSPYSKTIMYIYIYKSSSAHITSIYAATYIPYSKPNTYKSSIAHKTSTYS